MLSPFMQMILNLERAAQESGCDAVTKYEGRWIKCRVVYTEVHKYRASFYRRYWLDDVELPLLRIQEEVCANT